MTLKLKDIYLFEWINTDYVNMIIDNSRRVNFLVWDTVLLQWSKSDNSAYIIQEWTVNVEIDWNIVSTLSEWEIFWEIALITNEPRVASIIAKSDLILLKIDKELLHTIIKEFKNWKEIQKVLMKRIHENIKK